MNRHHFFLIRIITLVIIAINSPRCWSAETPVPVAKQSAIAASGRLPLSFETKATPGHYLGRSSGYTVSVAPGETQLTVWEPQSGAPHNLKLAFEGSNTATKFEELAPLPGVTNYYVGSDSRNWRLGVKNFAKLRAPQIYPGVDLVYYGDQRRFEFDFVVSPGADPGPIALDFSGADKLYTNQVGDLMAEVGGHAMRLAKPVAYQRSGSELKPVAAEYVLTANNRAQLRIGPYNKKEELVIDPVVTYATYLGGTQRDIGNGIAVDSSGNTYVTGETCSPSFPLGASNSIANCSAYVTELNAAGTQVVFTTIIGDTTGVSGIGVSGTGIALDSANGIYLIGNAYSRAALPSAVNTYYGGDSDAFIAELAPNGNLIRTAYLGGEGIDTGFGIAVDKNKNVVVTGQTCSDSVGPGYTFPAYNGFEERIEYCVAFITKLDNALDIPSPQDMAYDPATGYHRYIDSPPNSAPNGGQYYFSEFFAGQPINVPFMGAYQPNTRYVAGDVVSATVFKLNASTGSCDSAGSFAQRVVSTGYSGSDVNGPTAQGSPCSGSGWSTTAQGLTPDGTVTWVNEGAPSTLVYTFSQGNGVALDSLGDVFAVGQSGSQFIACDPATCENFSFLQGKGAWVLKVGGNATSTTKPGSFIYQNMLSATITDTANAVAVDQQNRAYVVGTTSGGLITPVGSITVSRSNAGGLDAFISRMNTAGTSMEYASYLGGSGDDLGLGVTVDQNGTAYVAGSTKSSNFPTVNPLLNPLSTPPYLPMNTLLGAEDAFVTKIVPDGSAIAFSTYLGGTDADHATSIAVHPNGTSSVDMYVTGVTNSSDFPVYPVTAPTPVQTTYADAGDAFVAQIPGASTTSVNLSPSSLGFVSQTVGTTSTPKLVIFTNTGNTPLNIASIIATTAACSGSCDFAQTNTCTSSLAAGADCLIDVSFRPTAASTRTGTLTVSYNGTSATIPLTGIGSTQTSGIPVTAAPTGLVFASQNLNTTSAAQTITLTNTSSNSVTIGSITTQGNFSQTNTCGSPLATNKTCTISVTFTPASLGNLSGAVNISVGSANLSVTLNGVSVTSGGSGSGSGGDSGGTNSTADFSLAPDNATGASQTVAAGTSAKFLLNVAPVNSTSAQTITFTCSAAGLNCSVSPSPLSLTGNSQVAVTVQTQAPSSSSGGGSQNSNGWSAKNVEKGKPGRRGNAPLWASLLPFGVLGIVVVGRRKLWLPLLIVALCLIASMIGCGGGSSSSTSGGTAPGNYQVAVTATCTPAGGTAITHTQNFTLTVK